MRRVAAAILFTACTGSPSAQPNPTGFVLAETQGMVGGGQPNGDGLARFNAHDVPGPEIHTYGPCDVSPNPAVGGLAQAGAITILGGLQDINLIPNLDKSYPQDTELVQLFKGDEMLTVHAIGGEIPGFVTTLRAPGPITITAPAAPRDLSYPEISIPRGQPLAVQWTGTGGYVRLTISDSPGNTIICRFRAADGSAMVPAEALAEVETGSSFRFDAIDYAMVEAGDWNVEVSAVFHASWNSAYLATGHLVFQ